MELKDNLVPTPLCGRDTWQIRKHSMPEKVKYVKDFNVGWMSKQDTYFILKFSQEKWERLSMEVSRLSCKRSVNISMCIHPDHTEMWALSCVATDGAKCQAASTVAKSLLNCAKHCPCSCSEGEIGSLQIQTASLSCFNILNTPVMNKGCVLYNYWHATSK